MVCSMSFYDWRDILDVTFEAELAAHIVNVEVIVTSKH